MSHELKEGARVKCAYWGEGSYKIGSNADTMTIREQPGQMSMVPWIRLEVRGKPDQYLNCALMEGIELED